MVYNKKGAYRMPDGSTCSLQKFHFRQRAYELREYGCSVAVELFLSFNVKMCFLFLLMFIGVSPLPSLSPPLPCYLDGVNQPLPLVPNLTLPLCLTLTFTLTLALTPTLTLTLT